MTAAAVPTAANSVAASPVAASPVAASPVAASPVAASPAVVIPAGAAPTMRSRFAEVTTALLDEDPRAMVTLADISADLFVGAARTHPSRVVNVGIREQLLISVTAGLAFEGLRPIAHPYAPFLLERPFEQVKLDLGHQDVGAVLVSVGASYDAAGSGRTHHAPGDVALLDTLPGWTVHVPGHPDEVEALLRAAVAGDDRVYLRLSDQRNAAARAGADGRMVALRQGRRGTVVAVGPTLDRALAATAGMDVTVLYAATVRPFDADTLVATLDRPDVVLVEPYLAGTSAHAVTAALRHVPHRQLPLGVGRRELRRYGTPAEHDGAHGLDATGIRAALDAFLLP
jgi:transketolase